MYLDREELRPRQLQLGHFFWFSEKFAGNDLFAFVGTKWGLFTMQSNAKRGEFQTAFHELF